LIGERKVLFGRNVGGGVGVHCYDRKKEKQRVRRDKGTGEFVQRRKPKTKKEIERRC